MKKFSFLILIVILCASCTPDKPSTSFKGGVSTLRYENVTDTSADCKGGVWITQDNTICKESGICYALSENPTIKDSLKRAENKVGEFTIRLNHLKPDTTYWFRAYTKISEEVVYGDTISFKTRLSKAKIEIDSTTVALNQDLGKTTYDLAFTEVDKFELGGLKKWDLPTVFQLRTLFEKYKNDKKVEYLPDAYWSRDIKYNADSTKIFVKIVYFPSGDTSTLITTNFQNPMQCRVLPIHKK